MLVGVLGLRQRLTPFLQVVQQELQQRLLQALLLIPEVQPRRLQARDVHFLW